MTSTAIATSDATSITVRGRDLVSELIGRCTYTEMFYLLLAGHMPEPPQTRVLDVCLVTLMEHGLNHSTIIARLMADSVPDQIQVAVGAGLMAIGDVFAGTMEGCAGLLQQIAAAPDPDALCREIASSHRASRSPVPGFGHRTHKPDDPRTAALLDVLDREGLAGSYTAALRRLAAAVDAAAGRHITVNATGALAAALLEIGLDASMLRAVAAASRAAGLAGHIAEERQTGSARRIWDLAREHVPYQVP